MGPYTACAKIFIYIETTWKIGFCRFGFASELRLSSKPCSWAIISHSEPQSWADSLPNSLFFANGSLIALLVNTFFLFLSRISLDLDKSEGSAWFSSGSFCGDHYDWFSCPTIMCETQGQTMYYTASKSQPIPVLTLTSDAFDLFFPI